MWFSVSILFEYFHEEVKEVSMIEEQIRLYESDSGIQVTDIASKSALGEELRYQNEAGENIHVRFLRVSDVFEVDEGQIPVGAFDSGVEVFSRFCHPKPLLLALEPFED